MLPGVITMSDILCVHACLQVEWYGESDLPTVIGFY